jgi:dCTP deaminase
MMPQVLDAKGDIRDCQREHPSRKLAALIRFTELHSSPAETSLEESGSFAIFATAPDFGARTYCVSIAQLQNHPILNSEEQVREGVISYGLYSYGDDLRVADEFKIFTNVNCTVVDPKNFDERSLLTMRSEVCTQFIRISPLGGILQDSPRCSDDLRGQEQLCPLRHPRDRHPFEPEWEGLVTLEISDTTPLPARIYAHKGPCQILFFRSDEACETSQLRRPQGQIPVTEWDCAAEVVGSREGNWLEPGAEETLQAQPLPSASEHSP